MDCLQCGGTYTKKSGTFSLVDDYVGNIAVDGVTYYECQNCGDILYSKAMAQAIESRRIERIHELLSRFPVRDFATSADTASILGISRQALHKNRRIGRGFIYQLKFGLLTLYLRQSVQQYKETGDGRFPLHLHMHRHPAEYLARTTPFRLSVYYTRRLRQMATIPPFDSQEFEHQYMNYLTTTQPAIPFTSAKFISPKESIYAK